MATASASASAQQRLPDEILLMIARQAMGIGEEMPASFDNFTRLWRPADGYPPDLNFWAWFSLRRTSSLFKDEVEKVMARSFAPYLSIRWEVWPHSATMLEYFGFDNREPGFALFHANSNVRLEPIHLSSTMDDLLPFYPFLFVSVLLTSIL